MIGISKSEHSAVTGKTIKDKIAALEHLAPHGSVVHSHQVSSEVPIAVVPPSPQQIPTVPEPVKRSESPVLRKPKVAPKPKPIQKDSQRAPPAPVRKDSQSDLEAQTIMHGRTGSFDVPPSPRWRSNAQGSPTRPASYAPPGGARPPPAQVRSASSHHGINGMGSSPVHQRAGSFEQAGSWPTPPPASALPPATAASMPPPPSNPPSAYPQWSPSLRHTSHPDAAANLASVLKSSATPPSLRAGGAPPHPVPQPRSNPSTLPMGSAKPAPAFQPANRTLPATAAKPPPVHTGAAPPFMGRRRGPDPISRQMERPHEQAQFSPPPVSDGVLTID